jgi:two-component system, OmpR family, phosphate regulon sensor histidine kinase PhoR
MFERRSLRWPIALGVVMIILVVAVTVGWVLVTVIGGLKDDQRSTFYWTWLPIGSTMLVMILVGVVLYLTLSIKAINLNRRQSNFIDSVTHELKSPIAALKLYLQTLNRRVLSAEERDQFYRDMLEDVERLDNLISNLLDVARLDRGDAEGVPEEVLLSEILTQCANAACHKHSLPVEAVQLNLKPCYIMARKVDLEMIFRNLIDNAIKYGGNPPEVQVTTRVIQGTRDGKDTILVEVADNGSGIPLAMRRKIFGRFVRLGSELEREKTGIGLGLYLVRTLVERLKGRIRVYDYSDRTGCVFEVKLPGRKLVELHSTAIGE